MNSVRKHNTKNRIFHLLRQDTEIATDTPKFIELFQCSERPEDQKTICNFWKLVHLGKITYTETIRRNLKEVQEHNPRLRDSEWVLRQKNNHYKTFNGTISAEIAIKHLRDHKDRNTENQWIGDDGVQWAGVRNDKLLVKTTEVYRIGDPVIVKQMLSKYSSPKKIRCWNSKPIRAFCLPLGLVNQLTFEFSYE